MRFSNIIVATALPSAVFGAPAATTPAAVSSIYSVVHSAECQAVNILATALKLVPTASQFCSSYLSIPTITSTATTTSTTVVPATSTTFTSTSIVVQNVISTTTATSTSTTFTSTQINTAVVTNTITAPTSTVTYCSGSPVAASAPSKRDEGNELVKRTSIAVPNALKIFASSQVSTACLCLNIPTPTSTVTKTIPTTSTSTTVLSLVSTTSTTSVTAVTTTTVVVTASLATTTTTTVTSSAAVTPTATVVSCPPPAQCNNQGLQFAAYPNTDGADNATPYSNFNPTDYKAATPECTGTTNSLGGFDYQANPNGLTVYGTCSLPTSDYFVLNHRGYIYAQQTGTYTFSATKFDDIIELWVGPVAYSGWNRGNAAIDDAFRQTPSSFPVQLTAGVYEPIRIVFGQAQGAAAFQMSVTAPDGTEFLGPDTGASPYLVSYSCDGTTAPQYPPFGQET